MLISYTLGQTSVVLRVKLRQDTTGANPGNGKTALTSASAGLIISTIADNEASATAYTQAGSTIEAVTTLGTFSAPTATKCRFKLVDNTNHPGVYEIQIADARFAVSSAKSLLISISGVSGVSDCDVVIPLLTVNPYDVNEGLQGLKGATNPTAGALITSGTGTAQLSVTSGQVILQAGTGTGQLDFTSGVVKANAVQLLGTGWLTPATAGTPDVNTKLLGGTAQTGRDIGASVLLSSGTGTGQVKLSSGYVAPNWGDVGNPTTTVGLTNTTISTTQAITSVSGSVGSVTGAVGSVTGAVGSVTAAVTLSAGDSPVMQSGTATAGGASTITIQTALGADSLPVGCEIKITSGTGAKQCRVITAYVDSTQVVTVDRAWTTNPNNTSVYSILYRELPALSSGLKITDVALVDTLTTYTGNTPQTGDVYGQLPSHFSALLISAGGHISNVDTLTTYTGDTPQTGDSFALIGTAGVGLTNIGDARIAHLNADVSSRSAPATAQTIDLTTAVVMVDVSADVTATVGKCLLSARAQAAGAWSITGTTLLLKNPDGSTFRTFTLDSATAPTSRT